MCRNLQEHFVVPLENDQDPFLDTIFDTKIKEYITFSSKLVMYFIRYSLIIYYNTFI